MDKQRLTTLINQPSKLQETDFRELSDLKKEYPYFQALSPLITIGSKKFSPQNEKKYLQSAAIYALDRKHLKEILTEDYYVFESKQENVESQEKQIPQSNSKTLADSIIEDNPSNTTSHLPDSFFEDLIHEMEALKAEKENYQKTLDRIEAKKASSKKTKTATKTTSKAKSPKTATLNKTTTAKKSAPKTKAASSKKTSQTKKSTPTKSTVKKTTAPKAKESSKKTASPKSKRPTKTAAKKPKKDEHDIIEEITSRKELKISDAHKKEQLSIINNFIEKEPILTKRIDTDNQSNKQEAEDLSASSVNLSDDVVSETLAKLMIKQGRKQKAIDIYKKLIWKFPQKKTYFVEIIDELKKES
ncbi:hypothetical protein SAMN05661096_00920 [Marivirga sericea]|uniref:Tetratricopeptide repeat-containing protein n=1 Tax=Marivirga sericea TaxID=1028 RepID=A0A1X7IPV0_9BACT|nr:tetratricopeptide repeat protein [Marivirga sericea]SMG17087.1 hypothetical protein SAMN05661096_00920 [Marivirga sericea]